MLGRRNLVSNDPTIQSGDKGAANHACLERAFQEYSLVELVDIIFEKDMQPLYLPRAKSSELALRS